MATPPFKNSRRLFPTPRRYTPAVSGPPEGRGWIHPSELPPEPVEPTPPTRHRAVVPLTAGLAGALAAFGLTALVFSPGSSPSSGSGAPVATSSSARPLIGGPPRALLTDPTGLAALAESVGPALVAVAAWTGPQVRYGSGIVYREDGLVVTVASLVEGATAVEVSTVDGRPAEAELVGADPDNDIALLRVDRAGLVPLAFAERPPSVRVGEPCALVGAAHDAQEGPWAAHGTVAAVGKVVRVADGWMVDVFEVDARLDTTGVGGALFDRSGTLLAVLTDAGGEAVSGTLAVPATTARRSVEQLLARGRVDHPWLGLATSDTATPVHGALVQVVDAEGPAASAGLLPGDVVVDLGGREVRGMGALLREVRRRQVGEAVVLGVVRGSDRLEVTVTLAPRPRATMGR